MIETILKIDGMACGMCESHINDVVRRTCSVKKVTSSHTRGETVILSEQPVDEAALRVQALMPSCVTVRGGADLRLPAGEGRGPLCGGDAPLVPPYRYALAGQSGGAPHGLRHRVHGRRKGVSRPSLRPDAYDTADRRFCSRGASSAT